jgi:EmrB/QacA subfamily drug resistance transporter
MTATTSTPTHPEDPRASADRRRWKTLAVLCLSLLITVLDTTVVNVALPTLDRTLHASSSGLEWIVDAYTLVFAGLLMLGGALGDRYGRHRALPTGLVIFGAGSVIAALAANVSQLIAARAVMGAGAALVMPATLSILTGVFTDPAERAKAIGIWSAVSGLGVALGPTLGGLLLEHFPWSSIFLINIPVVLVALIAGRRLIPASRAPRPRRIDITGATLSVAGLSALTYTLIQAPSNGWTSSSTILTGALAACLLAAFVTQQIRRTDPLIDLRLFANPRFSAASGGVMALFFALTAATFVLTQIYQFVLGYSPLAAGLRALAPALMVAIAAPIGAKIAGAKGPRLPITTGLLLATGGLCLFATANPDAGYLHYMIAMTFVGLGVGLSMAPATHSIMSSVPPRQSRRRLRDQRHHPQPRRRPGRGDRRQHRHLRLQDRPCAGHHPPRPTPPDARRSIGRTRDRDRQAHPGQHRPATDHRRAPRLRARRRPGRPDRRRRHARRSDRRCPLPPRPSAGAQPRPPAARHHRAARLGNRLTPQHDHQTGATPCRRPPSTPTPQS